MTNAPVQDQTGPTTRGREASGRLPWMLVVPAMIGLVFLQTLRGEIEQRQ